jgi:hypothetical protein
VTAYAPADRLQELRTLDHRLGVIAYRLAIANLDICPSQSRVAGWTLHDLSQYRPGFRDDLRRFFSLTDHAPGLMAVAPDGPAQAAGLQPDDTLLAIGSYRLDQSSGLPATARADRFEMLLSTVQAALQEGDVPVEVERGGQRHQFRLRPRLACDYLVQLIPSSALNAGADGRQVSITSGLAAYLASDDDLAVAVAHELAHNILGHAALLERRGLARRWLGGLATSPGVLHRTERQADRLGLFLAARAGYDVTVAPAFWRRMARDHPSAGHLQWGHPTAQSRAIAAEATIQEIEALRASGASLLPTLEE